MRSKNRPQAHSRRIFLFISVLFLLVLHTDSGLLSQTRLELKKEIASVLSQDKYKYEPAKEYKPVSIEVPDKLVMKIFKAIARIFHAMGYFSLIIPVLFGFLIWRIAVHAAQQKKKTRAPASDKKFSGAGNHTRFGLDPLLALARAEELISAARYREALEVLFSALWLSRHERGLVPYQKSLTNREYSEMLKQEPDHPVISGLVMTAEKAVFGKQDPDQLFCRRMHSEISILIA
jgi:hypothetical protein